MVKDIYVADDTKTNPQPPPKSETKPDTNKPPKPMTPSSTEDTLPLARRPEEYSEVMRKIRPTTNPLAAFVVRPRGFKFENQDREERVLLLLRKHFITNLGWILAAFVMALVPLLLPYLPGLPVVPLHFQFFLTLTWYLAVIGYTLEQFLVWYFNVYIITDERLVDYDFYSLLYKRVSEAKIDRVEDVTFQLGGVLRSLLNFGTVFIQTAGEEREFEFEDIPQPEIVVKLLNELQLEEEREKLEGRVN